MILVLLQPADDNHGDDALDALDADGHAAAMDGVLARLLRAHAEARGEGGLVAGELVVQEPGARAPAEHAGALALHPGLVVREGAGADGGLEEDMAAAVGEGDGDDGGLAGGGEGEEAGVEEVAELEGVFGGEG